MLYKLNITNIKPFGTEDVAMLDDGTVVRQSTYHVPTDCKSLFEQDGVDNEIEAIQLYVRSMMLALADLEFNWTLSEHEGPIKDAQYKMTGHFNEYAYLDDDVLHGELGQKMVDGEIPTIEVIASIRYKDSLKLLVDAQDIEKYNGRLWLMVRDMICEYLPTTVLVGIK